MTAATINVRVEPNLKAQAESILNKIGLPSSEAIRLFYTQICLQKGLPFDPKILNRTKVKAMQNADMRKTCKAKSVKGLLDD
ncbi:MAG: type toxin-antitoxin system RelB/DinJ family antitoxin [Gammaproteobacteria bacterium]|jgi:DNA-damage-inducible protein J|nr:type toxin-antitoxin system RelB/DinJ family antitoxin [Gammaproteobacteria bacterium]